MNILNKFARIRRCTPEDIPVLQALAKEDDHCLVLPTHVVEKDQRMIGFISLGALPTVFVWLHRDHTTPRDSAAVANFFECSMTDRERSLFLVPCLDTSPFYPYLGQLDYINLGKTNLFLKQPR